MHFLRRSPSLPNQLHLAREFTTRTAQSDFSEL
jgi:hypothetical protein